MSWFFSSSSSGTNNKVNEYEELVKAKGGEEREKARLPVIQALQTRFDKISRGSQVWLLEWDMREGLFTAQIGHVQDRMNDMPDNQTALLVDSKVYKVYPLVTAWTASGLVQTSVTKLILPLISEPFTTAQQDHAIIRSLFSPYVVLFKDF